MYYFPLSPRLLRLYASKATANDMRWHAEHDVVEGKIRHCSNSIAWKHFNTVHPDFTVENRNVRLGLCTDGFQLPTIWAVRATIFIMAGDFNGL